MSLHRAAIDRYLEGAELPRLSMKDLTPEELNSHPIPGTWSIREVILHLMDSDLVGADRMKRVIAEDNPTLLAYDETAWARGLGYDRLDLATASEIFKLNRQMMVQILRGLPDETFARVGMHTERGRETLEDLVNGYCDHLDHHLKFIRAKRERLGK